MIYSKTVTTPKNTLIASPKKTQLSVTSGLVYNMEVLFPIGSAGLLGVAIFDGSTQIWPSNAGEWFRGEGILCSFDDVYLKQDEPFVFDIVTYNLDDTYDHEAIVRVGLVSQDIFMARFLPNMAYGYFEQMLKNLQQSQAEIAAKQQESILSNPLPLVAQITGG
jgi:hypothetical protein